MIHNHIKSYLVKKKRAYHASDMDSGIILMLKICDWFPQ